MSEPASAAASFARWVHEAPPSVVRKTNAALDESHLAGYVHHAEHPAPTTRKSPASATLQPKRNPAPHAQAAQSQPKDEFSCAQV